MLFNITKQKSSALIKLFVTLLIVLVPTFLNMLSLEAAVNMMFTLSAAMLLIHIKANEKLNMSLSHIAYAVLIAFGVISLIWVNNTSGQFTYLFALALFGILYVILKEYFAESNDSFFKRRILYLFSISGTVCAFYNFVYWITEIVPVAKNEAFNKGLGNNDLLGIFSAVCLICTCFLFKGNSKPRKVWFSFSVVIIFFCFLMTRSGLSVIFAITFVALLFLTKKCKDKKSGKYFMHMSVLVLAYISVFLIMFFNSENGKIFGDVFSYGGNNLFGAGGGFITGSGNFTASVSLLEHGVGLIAYLFASSGVLGLLAGLLFASGALLLFVKNKNMESAIGVILAFTILFLPFGNGIGCFILVLGLMAYNGNCVGTGNFVQLKNKQLRNITTTGIIFVIIMTASTIISLVEMKANHEFESGNYSEAYSLGKIVSAIDIFDSECNRIAASSIRNDEKLFAYKQAEALKFIDAAIENDSENLLNYEEKAKIYLACSEYDNAAAQYRLIISDSMAKDQYKLDLTNVLYMIVEQNDKGSSATKRAYEEMVELAQSTYDLEVRAKIMDVADKALVYTKGDLSSDEETLVD